MSLYLPVERFNDADVFPGLKKARADGISAKLEVWPGMFHVFQSHEPLLPEAREAIDHVAEFMRSSLSKR